MGVTAPVDRVGEDVQHGVVDRSPPDHSPPLRAERLHGQLDALLPQPQQYLTDAAERAKLRENQLNGLADTPVEDRIRSGSSELRI